MTIFFARFLDDEYGATAIEYALIAASIALAIITAVNTLGQSVLTTKFQAVNNAIAP